MPGAITAPAISVVAAQPPTPPTSSDDSDEASDRCRRIDGARQVERSDPGVALVMTGSPPALCQLTLQRQAAWASRRADAAALARISSFGPKALHPALAHHQQRSTPASALGRCATTTTMPPRLRTPRMACVSASRLRASRLELGSSSTTRNGSPIERAGERDALPLPGRKRRAALADLRLVAVRQPQDHVVHAGGLGRRDDGLRVGVRLEAGDVLRHRAGEQLDVLRQVADVPAERLAATIGRARRRRAGPCRAPASRRRPAAGQRRFAGRARADDAEPVSRPRA